MWNTQQMPSDSATWVRDEYVIRPSVHPSLAAFQKTYPFAAFFGDAYTDGSNTWMDVSMNPEATRYNNRHAKVTGKVTLTSIASTTALTGTAATNVEFPVIPHKNYTIVYVARYDGPRQAAIFQSPGHNWVSGFNQGKVGYVGHGPGQLSNVTMQSAWLLGIDTHFAFRSNGQDNTMPNTPWNATSVVLNKLTINGPGSNYGYSDWACACVLMYDRILSSTDIALIENELMTRYGRTNFANVDKIVGYLYWKGTDNQDGSYTVGPGGPVDNTRLVPNLMEVGTMQQCKNACDANADCAGFSRDSGVSNDANTSCLFVNSMSNMSNPTLNTWFKTSDTGSRCTEASQCIAFLNTDDEISNGTLKASLDLVQGLVVKSGAQVIWSSNTPDVAKLTVTREVNQGWVRLTYRTFDDIIIAYQTMGMSTYMKPPFKLQFINNNLVLVDASGASMLDVSGTPVTSLGATQTCQRPGAWCGHGGATYRAVDCLGNGVAGDHLCEDTAGNRGTILRSDNCVSVWPSATGCKNVPAKTRTWPPPVWVVLQSNSTSQLYALPLTEFLRCLVDDVAALLPSHPMTATLPVDFPINVDDLPSDAIFKLSGYNVPWNLNSFSFIRADVSDPDATILKIEGAEHILIGSNKDNTLRVIVISSDIQSLIHRITFGRGTSFRTLS
jgi:hypothetical protein